MKSSVFKERRKNLADLILNNELYVPMNDLYSYPSKYQQHH